MWTGIEAPSYAPDVPLSGVAALAPAANLVALANELETSKLGTLFASFMLAGYSDAYANVAFYDYIRASTRKIVRGFVGRCLSEPATLLSLPAVLTGENGFSRPLNDGPLGPRLAQNVPERHAHPDSNCTGRGRFARPAGHAERVCQQALPGRRETRIPQLPRRRPCRTRGAQLAAHPMPPELDPEPLIDAVSTNNCSSLSSSG